MGEGRGRKMGNLKGWEAGRGNRGKLHSNV